MSFKGTHSTSTAAEVENVYLPDKFVCRICEKVKSTSQFSNKELNAYKYKKSNGQNVTGFNAKLRCRGCAGDQVHELECQGPCGLYKALDGFSKSQRKRSEQAWCMTCIYWKESNEPGVTPMPSENMRLAPDEERELAEFVGGSVLDGNPEGESDSDDEEFGLPRFSMGPNSLGGAPDSQVFSGVRSQTSNSSHPSYVAPHLRGPSIRSSNVGTLLSESNPYARHTFSNAGETIPEETDTEDTQTEKSKENQTPRTVSTATNTKVSGLSSNIASGTARGWAKVNGARGVPQTFFPKIVRPRQQPQQTNDDDSGDEM